MTLFSETYNLYFQMVRVLLERKEGFSKRELGDLVGGMGFGERALSHGSGCH